MFSYIFSYLSIELYGIMTANKTVTKDKGVEIMQPYKVWLFSDLLEKNKRVLKVPVYQRNYDWSNIHCEKLYHDIMVANERDHKHFTQFF